VPAHYRLGVGADEPVFTTDAALPGAVRTLLAGNGAPGTAGGRVVVFFSGFMVSPWSYRSLFASIVSAGTTIVAPQMYRRGPGPLFGRPSAGEEAEQGIRLVEHVVDTRRPDELWLAGHSRGGQVAWRVAERVDPDGIVVIDPVDGAGRNPSTLAAAAAPATFSARTLVIGAGIGDRCAPTAVNHQHFAAAAPAGSTHAVIASMGHGDVLDDRPARMARRLCGGSADPRHERAAVAEIVRDFIDAS
jgi:pimeloyl-ACP methyl ester carboxylesterase